MRLFIAINFNERIKDDIMSVTRELQQVAAKGNYTLRDNLHLTVVFLGEINQDRIGLIKSAMNRIKAQSFLLSFDKTGLFKRNGGNIYWIGLKENPALTSIYDQLYEELSKAGFRLEERKYTPHLTIGREVKLKDPSSGFQPANTLENNSMNVTRIILMKSERVNGKLKYTEVYGKDLAEDSKTGNENEGIK